MVLGTWYLPGDIYGQRGGSLFGVWGQQNSMHRKKAYCQLQHYGRYSGLQELRLPLLPWIRHSGWTKGRNSKSWLRLFWVLLTTSGLYGAFSCDGSVSRISLVGSGYVYFYQVGLCGRALAWRACWFNRCYVCYLQLIQVLLLSTLLSDKIQSEYFRVAM